MISAKENKMSNSKKLKNIKLVSIYLFLYIIDINK